MDKEKEKERLQTGGMDKDSTEARVEDSALSWP